MKIRIYSFHRYPLSTFSSSGYCSGDRAFLLYLKWKASDFKKMESLLEQGLNCASADKCEFPKKVSNEGTGLRGGFEKADDRWLLRYYLAGD
jgi:hypothetical protein